MVLSFCMGILTYHYHISKNFTDPLIEIPTQPVPDFARYKNTLTYNVYDMIPASPSEETSLITQSSQDTQKNTPTQNFVAAKSGTKYYPKDCGSANRIKPENKIYFSTEKEAEEKGYSRSATCN